VISTTNESYIDCLVFKMEEISKEEENSKTIVIPQKQGITRK
jgi:hypothetical protein